jgi:hypothetical protein
MSTTITLSPAALVLFRQHVDRHGQIDVDDATRPLYRELAASGLMRAVSTYAGGPESAYRITKEGFERKAGLLAIAPEPGSAA